MQFLSLDRWSQQSQKAITSRNARLLSTSNAQSPNPVSFSPSSRVPHLKQPTPRKVTPNSQPQKQPSSHRPAAKLTHFSTLPEIAHPNSIARTQPKELGKTFFMIQSFNPLESFDRL